MRALDLKGLPLGEASFAFKAGERETEAELDLPVEIRNDIARLRSPASARPARCSCSTSAGAAAPSASSPARPPTRAQPLLASTYYLHARARPVRRRAARRARLAGAGGEPVPRAAAADADPRRCRQCRRGARPARRAGSRTAACWCASPARALPPPTTISCRSSCAAAAASSAAACRWEQPQQLAAFSRESPFFGMAGAERRDRDAPGPGRTRCRR